MIREQDLHEAIAECQGVRNPNAETCIKLAAFYIILDHIKEPNEPVPQYSYAPPPDIDVVMIESESEFAKAINGRPQDEIWPIVDELMDVLKAINPRLYDGVMRKLE